MQPDCVTIYQMEVPHNTGIYKQMQTDGKVTAPVADWETKRAWVSYAFDEFGHTPLSAHEELPWGGGQLIIGTGAYGSLPIMPQVLEEARRRGVDLTAISTEEACRLIAGLDRREVHAVLHVTC